MTSTRHQFGLLQIFLALTAIGFALAALRSSGVNCYVLGAFAALLAGGTVLEQSKYAGAVAFAVMLGIHLIRLATA